MFRWCARLSSKFNLLTFQRFKHGKVRITLPVSEAVVVFNIPSADVYLNLAYENWMYENLDLQKHDILLFWQNSPCVVIGRHQNPWLETNGKFLASDGIQLARRYSGGGTVYHDLGNLNISFLTKRTKYNRKTNLESIKKALFDIWELNVDISTRDDLLVGGLLKVSGSAAKLGKHSSYHHCTLLCDTNLDKLNKSVLNKSVPQDFVTKSHSTQSIISQVTNLKAIEPKITVTEIIKGVVKSYCQPDQNSRHLSVNIFEQYVPEIEKMRVELKSWQWVYGKTSSFSISIPLSLSLDNRLTLTLEVVTGRIKSLNVTPNKATTLCEEILKTFLIGICFMYDEIILAQEKFVQSSSNLAVDKNTKKQVKEIFQSIVNKF